MDMAAGIEHLGRATAKAVDKLIVVVEPGRRSIETAKTIKNLAQDIGVQNIAVVGNKIRSEADKKFIVGSLPGFDFLGFIPYDQAIVDADLANLSVLESSQKVMAEAKNIYGSLLASAQSRGAAKKEAK
jgi:CO dehydrogenase maturation factor